MFNNFVYYITLFFQNISRISEQILPLNSQPIAKQNYISRKCVATNKIIAEKDHAAVQLDIADEVDEQTGRITRKTSTYTLTDSVRMMLVADDSIARLVTRDEFINNGYFFKDTK
ncbi:unnamed protein product [Rotaria sp. Silwood1]|nr:unnamed protein product [Rotaria sp. Silwood1]CAF1550375.1 unnamed protein product [Rotaria sp. Silwood1]CAF3642162.1 unnamed protein product [Rotaria sp. Silwood1]CAF3707151.1 unnamed protein product [Rotaria sp. Silwood1]